MWRCLVFAIVLAIAHSSAFASKSVVECEEELGEAAADRTKVQECLYLSMTGTPLPPPDPVNPNAYVLKLGIDRVNSANGVEPYIELINPNKDSAIKYATFALTLYNGVGDAVQSSIGGGATKLVQFTGPLTHAAGSTPVSWGPVWYNSTAKCIALQSVSIEFMNGRKVSFSGKQLRSVLASTLKNSCKVQ